MEQQTNEFDLMIALIKQSVIPIDENSAQNIAKIYKLLFKTIRETKKEE